MLAGVISADGRCSRKATARFPRQRDERVRPRADKPALHGKT